MNDRLLQQVMDHPKIESLGVKKEFLLEILEAYNDTVIDTLLENGHIELGNGMIIEVVQLLNRVHVLRGTTYKSTRKFKLKLTLEDKIYKKIEDYYNKLEEAIK